MSGYGATTGNYGQYFPLFQSRAQLFPSRNPLDSSYTQVVLLVNCHVPGTVVSQISRCFKVYIFSYCIFPCNTELKSVCQLRKYVFFVYLPFAVFMSLLMGRYHFGERPQTNVQSHWMVKGIKANFIYSDKPQRRSFTAFKIVLVVNFQIEE